MNYKLPKMDTRSKKS